MRISDWSSDVCSSDLGGRVDLDEETGIDMGGCANVLKGSKPTGSGHIGVNSVIVEVEKWTGKPLRSDVETAHIIPLETGTPIQPRSEEHTSELQSLMRISYAVFCLKQKNQTQQ